MNVMCVRVGFARNVGAGNSDIRVTIRNETGDGGLFLTPVWFGLHDSSFNLFDDGAVASAGLESLAEDGEIATIGAKIAVAEPDGVAGAIFGNAGAGGPIDPGATLSRRAPVST